LTVSNPTLKGPGAKHLTLKSDELLSNFAFKFNLRRYIEGNLLSAAAADKVGR
jgi:hypothetical protein